MKAKWDVGMHVEDFGLSPERGFLPLNDPIRKLQKTYWPWEEVAAEMPKLLIQNQLGHYVENLPLLDARYLEDQELERAMMILSFMAHGDVFALQEKPKNIIKRNIAIPWCEVAKRLGRPPVLSYASYCLNNWKRLNEKDALELNNIAITQNFLGGIDEDWFILIHVEIERRAAPIFVAGLALKQHTEYYWAEKSEECLRIICATIKDINKTLARMTEKCDPYIYFNRVRPFIHGFRHYPVVYEDVKEFKGEPQKFLGETGAQSSIIPFLDGLLNIEHEKNMLTNYLDEMRNYMPRHHARLIEVAESAPSVRQGVLRDSQYRGTLKNAYNECVQELYEFRRKHLEYAGAYIHRQHQTNAKNSIHTGTGGTPFMEYLKKHCEETKLALLS